MSDRRGLVGVATVAVLFFASVMGGHALRAARAPHLLPVPLISQARPWSCGAAALMATLIYFGAFDESESRLDADLGVTPEDGTRVGDIVSEARRFGVEARAWTGLGFEDLERELGRGALVIVALQAWADHPVDDWAKNWEDGHYAVVIGLSPERVYLMDPSIRTGYGYLTRDDFLRRWHDYDREGSRRTVYDRLGIVIHGNTPLSRFPAEPIRLD